MNNCNVLITSAGRRVSLVRLFQKALIKLDLNGIVFAVDLQDHAPALLAADKFQTVPKVSDLQYIKKLLEICLENKIKLVIPTIDTELIILSKQRKRFLSHGIQILTCSNNVNKLFFDKRSTQLFFSKNKIPTPHLYTLEEAKQLDLAHFPLLLKPNNGSCSIGVTKVHSQKELLFFLDYLKDPIVQEFIEGDEYTIDVLIDFNGAIKCIVPRLRLEIRAGEVSKSITVRDLKIIDWTYKICSSIEGALGCITIQCIKQKNGEIKFIEINPRFGGGFPLTAEAGADFPSWIIQMLLEIDIDEDFQNVWHDEYVMLRYDEALFANKEDFNL